MMASSRIGWPSESTSPFSCQAAAGPGERASRRICSDVRSPNDSGRRAASVRMNLPLSAVTTSRLSGTQPAFSTRMPAACATARRRAVTASFWAGARPRTAGQTASSKREMVLSTNREG
jgi:hypothetical protein